MYPNKRAFGRKTALEHQRSTTIIHSGYEVLFCMAIFLSTPNPSLLFVAKKLFIWSHLTIQPTHWKSDLHLANCRRFSLLLIDNRGFFLATLKNNLWWCRWRLMVVLETFWPQDSTNLCNSPAVILRDYFASRTILLTVRGVNLQTGPLPGWFLTSPVALNFLTIALIVEMGIFNCLDIFLYSFPDFCSSTTFCHTSTLCSFVFPILMND